MYFGRINVHIVYLFTILFTFLDIKFIKQKYLKAHLDEFWCPSIHNI